MSKKIKKAACDNCENNKKIKKIGFLDDDYSYIGKDVI